MISRKDRMQNQQIRAKELSELIELYEQKIISPEQKARLEALVECVSNNSCATCSEEHFNSCSVRFEKLSVELKQTP